MSGRVMLSREDIPKGGEFVEKTKGVGEIVLAVARMMSLDPRLDLLALRKFAA